MFPGWPVRSYSRWGVGGHERAVEALGAYALEAPRGGAGLALPGGL